MVKWQQQDYDHYRQDIVGYIFQDFNLLEGLTLKENIILPLALQKLGEREIQGKFAKALQYCGYWLL